MHHHLPFLLFHNFNYGNIYFSPKTVYTSIFYIVLSTIMLTFYSFCRSVRLWRQTTTKQICWECYFNNRKEKKTSRPCEPDCNHNNTLVNTLLFLSKVKAHAYLYNPYRKKPFNRTLKGLSFSFFDVVGFTLARKRESN